ncbi:hypothetical protein D3C72_461760 [compost metagenome]
MPGANGHRAVDLGQPINVSHLDAHFLHRTDDLGRWCGACKHGVDRMIEGDFGRVGQVDQPIEDNRRTTQMADPMLVNQRENFVWVDAAQEHVSPGQRSDCPRIAPAIAMEHRQCPEVHRVVPHGPGHLIAQ